MTERRRVDRTAARPDGAERVADLIAFATEMLYGDIPPTQAAIAEFTAALDGIDGVHAVSILSPPELTLDTNDDAGMPPARQRGDGGPNRQAMVLPLTADDRPVGLLVELAGADDPGWPGDRQQQRLRAALTLIATAATRTRPVSPDREDKPPNGMEPYELLLGHDRSIVVRIDRDGSWSILSDSVTPVLGYLPDQLPGNPASLVHPDDRAPAARAMTSVRNGRQRMAKTDIRLRTAHGAWRRVETVFHDMTAVPGIEAVIGYGLDVTEQRSAEERAAAERARLREVVMRLHAAVLMEDETGRTVFANDAFANTFGGAGGHAWVDVDRRHVLDAVLGECADPGVVAERLTELAETRRRAVGYRLDLLDGRCVELDYLPITCGGTDLGVLWYFRDITEMTAAEHELRERNRVLLEAAELKNQFVATVSHELGAPLTAVLSFASMLDEPERGPLTDVQRVLVDTVVRNARRMKRLVTDLLSLTRLERYALSVDRSPVDIRAIVLGAVGDGEPDARQHDVTVRTEVGHGPPVSGDAMWLHQVVANLLGNAVKFNRPGGSVTVRAGYQDPYWLIEFTDTGIGIPERELQQVTETFARASNAISRRITGSGLGLAICKQIVELHDGTLEIHSVVGEGTTVLVRLPTKPRRASREGAE